MYARSGGGEVVGGRKIQKGILEVKRRRDLDGEKEKRGEEGGGGRVFLPSSCSADRHQ